MDFGGRMPSPPLNVHWRPGRAGQPDHAKRRDLIDALALLIWATRSAHRGNDTTRKTTEASSRVAREQGIKIKECVAEPSLRQKRIGSAACSLRRMQPRCRGY